MTIVLSAHPWPTNAHLIEDVARLHLSTGMKALDPTYGRGVWWKRWTPDDLTALAWPDNPDHDFRAMPQFADRSFDLVAYDPPYVCKGERSTGLMATMNDRYGLISAPTTPDDLEALVQDGFAECARVVARRGVMLTKSMAYVSGGKLRHGPKLMADCARRHGLALVDEFVHLSTPRPQDDRPQRTSRRNYSVLHVWRKP